MLRFTRTQQSDVTPRALVVVHEDEVYVPILVHAAVDQDRAITDTRIPHDQLHESYRIILYGESSGQSSPDRSRRQTGPGRLVWVSPGQPHDVEHWRDLGVCSEITFSLESRSGKVLTLPFKEILDIYTGVPGQLAESPHLPKEATQKLVMNVIQIIDYLRSPAPISDFYAQRALANVFDMVVAHCFNIRTPGKTLPKDKPILLVKQYIDEHYAENFTAVELAAKFNWSRGHLFRAFKQSFHVSPLAYQQDLRFEEAQQLLRFTSLRCYEIAQRVGYLNVHYFHRRFKKRMGVTPNHFRQTMR